MKGSTINENIPKPVESYHGQILETGSGDEDDKGMEDWHVGKLKFRKKHIDDMYRNVAGDGRKLEDYTVVDPRCQDPMSLLGSVGSTSKATSR